MILESCEGGRGRRRCAPALLIATAIAGNAPAGAPAASVEVRVDTAAPTGHVFLIAVTGHYADFHLGHSRRWLETLVAGGQWQRIAVGPVNPLLNMGVSVSVYHPRYLPQRARSRERALPMRPVRFPAFTPRSWREQMRSGGAFDNGGPESLPEQVLAQVQTFVESWLPVVDAASRTLAPSEDALQRQVAFLEELVAFAERDESPPTAQLPRAVTPEQAERIGRSLANRALERTVRTRELLRRAQAWLSLPRDERMRVRELMTKMRYPGTIAEELFTAEDHQNLGAFLDRYLAHREQRREPQRTTSWTNAHNGVVYQVAAVDPPGECAYVSIIADLTRVTLADLGDMTQQVRARFCREGPGRWTYRRP